MLTPSDDPRLTAYALGELEGEEYAQVEALLAEDAAARALVEEVRAVGGLLRDELAMEEGPGLDEARRAAILGEEAEAAPALRLHVEEARSDVYRVITHPGAGARRDRRELLAIAASVAIVAATLTLILSSAFRGHGPGGERVVENNPPASQPTLMVFPPQAFLTEKGTELPDGFTSRPTKELLAAMTGDMEGPAVPFGVAGSISVNRLQGPTTGESNGGGPAYALTVENPFFEAGRNPVSGFAFNVGHASYAAVRRALDQKQFPAKDAVRIEQLVNFFPYDYAGPKAGETFAAHIEVSSCPWQGEHRLVRIGLKGKEGAERQAIAEDLRIRVEFNPARVGAYRLIGYDRRVVTREGSREQGKHTQVHAGQAVTALYEVIPAGVAIRKEEEALRYQKPLELTEAAKGDELLTVELRYADPGAATARAQTFAASDRGLSGEASDDFKFAAAVAGFGMLLRDSPHKGGATYDLVLALAEAGQRSDVLGERGKLVELIRQARGM